MGHIYYELPESPVPSGSKSDGDRVYMFKDCGRGERQKVYIGVYARKDENPRTFYPSERFRQVFPNLWEERYGTKNLARHIIGIGTYELALGIGHSTHIYPIIHSAFGPYNGNVLYDYAMYAILDRSNVAYLFKPAMEGLFLFNKDRIDDDKISEILCKKITHEEIEKFKVDWVQRCVASGIKEVWLAIDGSNSNYESKNSSLSQKGKAKSKKNVEIVSYIWAVSALDGLPVTFAVNDGSTSDGKAFDEIITFLKAYGIIVKGVILDKGFATHPVIKKIIEYEFDFVINLKDDSHAAKGMVEDYGEEIYWNIEYLAGKGGLFGVVSEEPRQIFQRHPEKAYIALYFDGKNGSERKVTLADKIDAEIVKIEDQIRNGEKPSVSKEMARYLSVVEMIEDISGENDSGQGKDGIQPTEVTSLTLQKSGKDGSEFESEPQSDLTQDEPAESHGDVLQKEVNDIQNEATQVETVEKQREAEAIDSQVKIAQADLTETQSEGKQTEAVDTQSKTHQPETGQRVFGWIANRENGKIDLWKKGFSALASSIKMSAREMNGIYHIRDSSETQYMVCKTLLGFDVFRSHGSEGVESRELVCFIAAIIRNRFSVPCKELKLKTCRVIEELDNKLFLILNSSGGYDLVNKLSENQKQVLHEAGIKDADISLIAGEICYRLKKDGVGISQLHDAPETIRKRIENLTGNNPAEQPEVESTDASNSVQSSTGVTGKEAVKEVAFPVQQKPRKVGRPPGRKNNKTLEREAAAAIGNHVQEPKRKRGRPPGRKNNKTLEREAAERELGTPPPAKRPKGRPVGSKDSQPRKRRTKAEVNAMKSHLS